MFAVVQRVSRASVVVDGRVVGQIGRGLLALVGIAEADTPDDMAWLAGKLPNLRIFEDPAGKMNLSLLDLPESTAGERAGLLLVPNFTLAGGAGAAHRGRRPSFDAAMRPEGAAPLFDRLVDAIRVAAPTLTVQTGIFRATMAVELVNDGPVTLILDSRHPGKG